MRDYDSVIIGGGFYGMYVAEHLRKKYNEKVLLVEKDKDFMLRASYVNQARIHNGYHYPRSILTALRSRVSFPRFSGEFSECVDNEFEKYYALGKLLGKVTAKQFERFCQSIGAFCEPAPHKVKKLFNPALIEGVFSTVEYAFDSTKLKNIMLDRLDSMETEYWLESTVEAVREKDGGVEVDLLDKNGSPVQLQASRVYNCTYARMNYVIKNSGVDLVPLKHEMTEMCLVTPPDTIKDLGITVMCGPFFSTMPFPSRGLYSLSHVRYTPHYEWFDKARDNYKDPYKIYSNDQKHSTWEYIIRDAQRYLPSLSDCKYEESIWEVKTTLPRSEIDDSRPILFKADYGIPNFHCILGGKIDNVYDIIEAIDLYLGAKS